MVISQHAVMLLIVVLFEYGRELPVDVRNGAILHAGPIVRDHGDE